MEDTVVELTNVDIEKIILNRLFKNPEYIPLFEEHLTEDMFENDLVKYNCMALLTYYKKYDKIPSIEMVKKILINLAEEKNLSVKDVILTFKNSMKTNFEVDESFVQSQILEYIKAAVVRNAIMSELQNIQDTGDVSGCIERMEQINKVTFDNDLGFEYFKSLDMHFDWLANPTARLSTGWKDMDEITNGGFPEDGRCLILFAGRANMGKSLFLSNYTVNLLKQGKNVVVISAEMSEMVYGQRFTAHISDIDINNIVNHLDKAKDKIRGFEKKTGSKLFIKEYPPSSINMNTVKNYIEKILLTGVEIDAIVIDYLALLNPCHGMNRPTHERLGDVCKEARALSYYFNRPVVSATQLNRSGTDSQDPTQSDISASDELNFHSDAIFSLYQKDEDMEKGIIRAKLTKNRFGLVGTHIDFNIDYQTLRITDFTEDIFADEPTKKSISQQLLDDLDINEL